MAGKPKEGTGGIHCTRRLQATGAAINVLTYKISWNTYAIYLETCRGLLFQRIQRLLVVTQEIFSG